MKKLRRAMFKTVRGRHPGTEESRAAAEGWTGNVVPVLSDVVAVLQSWDLSPGFVL